MKVNAGKTFLFACGMAGALVAAGAISLLAVQRAAATAQFAKDTGKSCGDCHTNPSGGGALTPLGEKFKANGNKMPN
jgi:mono/diheme cytochrome c family protein